MTHKYYFLFRISCEKSINKQFLANESTDDDIRDLCSRNLPRKVSRICECNCYCVLLFVERKGCFQAVLSVGYLLVNHGGGFGSEGGKGEMKIILSVCPHWLGIVRYVHSSFLPSLFLVSIVIRMEL